MSQEVIGVFNTKMSSLKTTTKCQEEVGFSVGSRETAFAFPLKRGGGDSHLIYSFTCDTTFITMRTEGTVCCLNGCICGAKFQQISVFNSVVPLLSHFRDLPTRPCLVSLSVLWNLFYLSSFTSTVLQPTASGRGSAHSHFLWPN